MAGMLLDDGHQGVLHQVLRQAGVVQRKASMAQEALSQRRQLRLQIDIGAR